MKLLFRSKRKNEKLQEAEKTQSLTELSEEEMMMIQGASSDFNDGIYISYAFQHKALIEGNRRIF